MKSDSKKSSNQIDQSPSMFGFSNDAKALTIDPANIRIVQYSENFLKSGIISSSPNVFSTNFLISGEELNEAGDSISSLLPKLEDIAVKSMVLDYTTNPVSVKLVLRIKNSTGYPVKGISGRVPKK